jgi:hypothetical protein
MENNNENANSLNGELNDVKVEENDDVAVLKDKAEKALAANRQLFERAKKAETEAKELRDFKAKTEEATKAKVPPVVPEQSDETDYGKLAYLHARGINDEGDVKIVQDEAKRLKLPLTEVLAMEHIKNKLQTSKEMREAQAGIPSGSGRGGGSGGKNEVDYWLAKGEGQLPMGNQELAEKVVNARMKKESSKKFSDIMFSQ